MQEAPKRPVKIFKATDTFIDCVEWGGNRAVLVHRREHGGRSYVRFRTWNRHLEKGVWYPTKRGFIVPLDRAEALAESLRLGAHGEPREKPDWLVNWELEKDE